MSSSARRRHAGTFFSLSLSSRLTGFAVAGLLILIMGLSDGMGQDTERTPERTRFPTLDDGTVILEDFRDDEIGSLPRYWYNRDGDYRPIERDHDTRDQYQYRVMEENGKRFLRYEGTNALHLNLPLINTEVDIHETPLLSWQWRIHDIPEGGDESSRSRNDVAASIYVVWGTNWLGLPRVVRYTWSSTLPEGDYFERNFNQQKVKVMGTGDRDTGTWLTFERNIIEDYREFFGSEPPDEPLAILILSAADDTRDFTKADYADIRLRPAQ